MNRVIKRAGILFGIFAAALLVYFIAGSRWRNEGQTAYVDMGEASLPVAYVEMFGQKMNPMVGYCQEMDNSAAGSSLTILPEDRTLAVYVDGAAARILGLNYEIRSMDRARLVERTQVEDWTQTETGLRAVLPIQNLLTKEQEYLLRLEVNTDQHGPVYYYTRILYTDNQNIQSMLQLASDFSAKTFQYEQAGDLTTYLEPSPTEDNSSLGRTTIHSSFSQLTWGGVDMEPASPVQVTLKELDGIMCSVQISYLAHQIGEETVNALYEVEENFTMKWNELRTYLMDYERQTNQIFQGNPADFSGKRLMLGITNDDRVEVKKSPDGNILAYRACRDLWTYNQEDRRAVKVFSFRGSDVLDFRNNYNRHDVKILSVEDGGDVDFLVYGYMNRGNYEGRMGVLGYHYSQSENALEELYFIPYAGSYDALEDDLNRLTHQTAAGMLYLYLDYAIFGIDLQSRENIVVADALEDGSFAVSADGSRIAWQDGGSLYESQMLHLMDLETGESHEISGGSGKYMRVLGFVGRDLVYGMAREDDVWVINGRVEELPMYVLKIVNDRMEEETSYERDGSYIANVTVEASRVHLNRVSKTGPNRYAVSQEDTIVCNADMGAGELDGIGWYASQNQGKLYFVQLDKDVKNGRNVRVFAPGRVSFEQADELELKSNYQVQGMRFYAYGAGHLKKVTLDFTEAVQAAYEGMGYVTDKNHRIIWNRVNRGGMRNIQEPASAFEPVQRCLAEFSGSKNYDDEFIIMDGRGCSMQQMLYFIDQGIPVLAYIDEGSCRLLCGFDQYNVTLYDPVTSESYKMGLNDAAEFFRQRGNDFICAVKLQ